MLKNIRTPLQIIIRTRNITSTDLSAKTNQNHDERRITLAENFTPIYNFPYIRYIGFVNRLKIYQAGLTAVCIPGSFCLSMVDVISFGAFKTVTMSGLSLCLWLYSMGYFSKDYIGFVYLHKNEDIIRVAYVDKSGKRKDEDVPLEDVVPLSELPRSLMDGWYKKFSRYSVKNNLKLSMAFGRILDKEKFDKVFNHKV